jgi:trehalose 6-phosphate phosphatase
VDDPLEHAGLLELAQALRERAVPAQLGGLCGTSLVAGPRCSFRGKDAGSPDSSAIGATEGAASGRAARPDDTAAFSQTRPKARRARQASWAHRRILGRVSGHDLLEELARQPERAALCLDVDGVLAPIVERPEDAAVPDETRAEVKRLAGRYALLAAVSGRASEDARRMVGVSEVVYVGSHGLERAPDAEHWRATLQTFLAGVEWPVENKGLTASLHYRTANDEDAARAELEAIAERAGREGLRTRFGRKVLELLPPIDADKGTAVRELLSERGLTRALYAGDDTTDLDGFRALDELELGVRVAVASPEGPPELRALADIVVYGPSELLALLRQL